MYIHYIYTYIFFTCVFIYRYIYLSLYLNNDHYKLYRARNRAGGGRGGKEKRRPRWSRARF